MMLENPQEYLKEKLDNLGTFSQNSPILLALIVSMLILILVILFTGIFF